MADSTDNVGGEALDQSEIDQLLAAVVVETRPPLIRSDGKRIGETEEVRVESYDFRNPTFLTEVELRRLRILHEDFIRYLASRLAMFLRMECGLKMARRPTPSSPRVWRPRRTFVCSKWNLWLGSACSMSIPGSRSPLSIGCSAAAAIP
jgi:flagellar motor switch protein FliM